MQVCAGVPPNELFNSLASLSGTQKYCVFLRPLAWRVCQAWQLTREVKVLLSGVRGA